VHLAARSRIDFDQLMRDLMLVGFGALLAWTLTGVVGVMSGEYSVEPQAALRFLLAVLVLVFARRTYWEIREWHWRRFAPDDRYGFTSPIWEHARSSEHATEHHTDVDEPPHPQG